MIRLNVYVGGVIRESIKSWIQLYALMYEFRNRLVIPEAPHISRVIYSSLHAGITGIIR